MGSWAFLYQGDKHMTSRETSMYAVTSATPANLAQLDAIGPVFCCDAVTIEAFEASQFGLVTGDFSFGG